MGGYLSVTSGCKTHIVYAIAAAMLLAIPTFVAAEDIHPIEGDHGPPVFGHKLIEVADGRLTVIVQPRPDSVSVEPQKIIRWLTAAADSITTIYGHFPVEQIAVSVIPVTPRLGETQPVPFGMVKRGPPVQVEFFVNLDRPLKSFLTDWTAVHEFSHLMLPYIDREAAWLSEGIATYYQYVALVRAGMINEQQAFSKFIAGLERGRQNTSGSTSLQQDSRQMREQQKFMRVYWSGMAFAMNLDVKLRQQSNNQKSLDAALLKFHHCCLPADSPWSPNELITRLDQLIETDLFSKNYYHYANRQDFPNMTQLFVNLGVSTQNGITVIDEEAASSSIRRAIMGSAEPL